MFPIKDNNNNNTIIYNNKGIVINTTNVNLPEGTGRIAATAISTAAGLKLANKIPNKAAKAALLVSSTVLPEAIKFIANNISK